MKAEMIEEKIVLPDQVQASYADGVLTVKSADGENAKKLMNPRIKITVQDGHIILQASKATKNEKKRINAFKAHINNLTTGVVEPFVYKLKICAGHFPMTVAVQNNKVVIKNFIGEKVPRTVPVVDGVDVSVKGEEIIVKSSNKEKAGQMAASIEQLTKRLGFDRRIFQDGCYIISKAGKELI